MRRVTRGKSNAASSALAVASLAVSLRVPSARGAFTVTAYDISDDYGAGTSVVGSTQPYTTWVFAAQTNGQTGTGILDIQAIIDAGTANPGAFGVDIENSNGRAGATARYTANVDGSVTPTNGIPVSQTSTEQSVFGDPNAGTFAGIGYDYNVGQGLAAPFVPGDISDNPFVTPGQGSAFKVYTNLQTQDYTPANNTAAVFEGATLPDLDASMTNSGTVNAGQINNGSLFSLEIDSVVLLSATAKPVAQSAADGPVPFLQVAVKTGVAFTLNAMFQGNGFLGVQSYSAVVSGSTVTAFGSDSSGPPPPPSTLSFNLTQTATDLLLAGNISISSAGTGNYHEATIPVTGDAQTRGYASATGLNPADDDEICGLTLAQNGTAVTGSTLAALVADIQASLNTDSGSAGLWTASALSANSTGAGPLLLAEGDNVEIDFPNADGAAYLEWNFSLYTNNGGNFTVTQASFATDWSSADGSALGAVLPEPSTLSLFAIAATGLLHRRRRQRFNSH